MSGDIVDTLTQVSKIVGGGLIVWRVIVFLHEASKTFKAIPTFMTKTTEGLDDIRNHANQAVTNHLTHMESGITNLVAAQTAQTASLDKFRERLGDFLLDMNEKQAVILSRLPE